MGDTKVVDTPNEIHARLQGLQTHSGMAAALGQGGQTLSKGGVEPLDKGGVEHGSSLRPGQQVLGPRESPLRHASGDLHHALVFRVLAHGGNQQVRPDDQRTASSSHGAFDLLANCSPNAGRKAA